MLFYFNTSGSVTTSIPSPIYQGSVGVNEILVLAPFPASTTVTAAFVLPNGVKLTPRVANPGTDDDGYTFANVPGFSIDEMHLWRLTLDKALTQYAGDLSVQFSFTDTSGRVLTSGAVSVTISAGAPSLPVYPTQEEFDAIAALRSQAASYCQDAEGYRDDAENAKLDAEQEATAAKNAKTAAEAEVEKAKTETNKAAQYANGALNAMTAAITAKNQAVDASTNALTAVSQANTLLAEVNELVGDLGSAFDDLHTYASKKKGGGV